MSTESETPRTDAAGEDGMYSTMVNHAMQIELELNAAKKTNQEPYTAPENTALLFAARYCHDRATGGTLALVKCLIANWQRLDERTQKQILEESDFRGVTNREDWERLYTHANYEQKEL